jgi:C2 domain
MRASPTTMRKIYAAVATAMLAVAVAGCSDPVEDQQLCSASSCPGGCCSNGTCEPGATTDACGAAGGVCAVCGQDESCVDGACKKVGGCTTGCADSSNVCQPGTANESCGTAGKACAACSAGQTCTAGVCTAACNHITCAQGCCTADGQCVQSVATSCGSGGAACATCKSGEDCVAGACVKKQDCSSCDGCCINGTQCMPGSSAAACGTSGATCTTCNSKESCVNGQCQAISCDKTSCPSGCCTANNQCIPFTQQNLSVCGKAAEACHVCGSTDKSCQQGTCVKDQPCLTFCSKGCCTASGQCLDFTSQSKTECGASGACKSCGALSCISGLCVSDPVWEVSVLSAVISAKNSAGKDWDSAWFTNPLPDPYAIIALGGASVLTGFTKTIDNTLTPFWNEKIKTYKESDLTGPGIRLGLRDSDGLGIFETIADCATLKLTSTMLAAGSHTIASCGSTVTKLKLKFVKQ